MLLKLPNWYIVLCIQIWMLVERSILPVHLLTANAALILYWPHQGGSRCPLQGTDHLVDI